MANPFSGEETDLVRTINNLQNSLRDYISWRSNTQQELNKALKNAHRVREVCRDFTKEITELENKLTEKKEVLRKLLTKETRLTKQEFTKELK